MTRPKRGAADTRVTSQTAFEAQADGVRLRVRLTPRSARDTLGPIETLANAEAVLVAHVRAVPERGAANAALEALLAKALGIAKTRVAVVAGATARVKTVRLEGSPADLVAALERLAASR